MVPTVERGLRDADFWSMEIAGRQPLDEVHVRLVHLAQELPGVAGERLHVAALSLGVDGVEGQRALPRAGQPGEDDEPVSRQVQRDVAKVVLAGPPNHKHACVKVAWHHSRVPANSTFAQPV